MKKFQIFLGAILIMAFFGFMGCVNPTNDSGGENEPTVEWFPDSLFGEWKHNDIPSLFADIYNSFYCGQVVFGGESEYYMFNLASISGNVYTGELNEILTVIDDTTFTISGIGPVENATYDYTRYNGTYTKQ
jgi:hypothetical protein